MSELSIRRAHPSELPFAYSIAQEYYVKLGVVVREDESEFLKYYFAPDAGFWLAEWNHEIVGCIALRNWDATNHVGEVKRMYVKPEYRGLGIAQSLLEALESFARDCGYCELVLDSGRGMESAVRLYERSGYVHCARYNDNPQAVVFLRKAIQAG